MRRERPQGINLTSGAAGAFRWPTTHFVMLTRMLVVLLCLGTVTHQQLGRAERVRGTMTVTAAAMLTLAMRVTAAAWAAWLKKSDANAVPALPPARPPPLIEEIVVQPRAKSAHPTTNLQGTKCLPANP
ncbi:hypothetical protein CS8_067440 [Cupriavidus sp. 8B]